MTMLRGKSHIQIFFLLFILLISESRPNDTGIAPCGDYSVQDQVSDEITQTDEIIRKILFSMSEVKIDENIENGASIFVKCSSEISGVVPKDIKEQLSFENANFEKVLGSNVSLESRDSKDKVRLNVKLPVGDFLYTTIKTILRRKNLPRHLEYDLTNLATEHQNMIRFKADDFNMFAKEMDLKILFSTGDSGNLDFKVYQEWKLKPGAYEAVKTIKMGKVLQEGLKRQCPKILNELIK